MSKRINITQIEFHYKTKTENGMIFKLYPMTKLYSKDYIAGDIPDNATLHHVSFLFGQILQELKDKKQLKIDNDLKYSNIDTFIDYLSNKERINTLDSIEYVNQDSQFDINDRILEWMNTSNLKSVTQLIYESQVDLSNEQFSTFNRIISQKMKKLNVIVTNFGFRGEIEKKGKLANQNPLAFLSLEQIQSVEQMVSLRFFPNLRELKLDFLYFKTINIQQILQQVAIHSLQIERLVLNFSIIQKLENGCLKEIEKLVNLKDLMIKIYSSLTKKDLNLNSLKQLVKFQLDCFGPINYLSSIGSNQNLSQINVTNLGCKKNSLSKFGKLKNLKSLSVQFSCKSKSYLQQLKNELTEIMKIAPQLTCLNLDFSYCQYFQSYELDNEFILILGKIFQACTNETVIQLVTKNCVFSQSKRLDLALEFMKIPNISTFVHNEYNIANQLGQLYNNENEEFNFQFVSDKYLPYIHGVLAQCQQYIDAKIPIYINRFLPLDLQESNSYRNLFSLFKQFILIHNNIIGFEKLNLKSWAEYYQRILPRHVIYLEIQATTTGQEMLQLIEDYKNLQTLKFTLDNYEIENLDIAEYNKKKRRKIQLDIVVHLGMFEKYESIFNIFKLQGYIINITLFICRVINTKGIFDLFEQINLSRQRILLEIQSRFDNDNEQFVIEINDYSKFIQIEKLKLIVFKDLIQKSLPINPKMVYFDLFSE